MASQDHARPNRAVTIGQTHTPGPWFWAEDASGRPTSLRRSGTGDVVIAPDNTPGEYAWLDVSEADAGLIAAAPELLEALKEARELVMDWAAYAGDYFREKHGLADDVAMLDAVIAKVEGK